MEKSVNILQSKVKQDRHKNQVLTKWTLCVCMSLFSDIREPAIKIISQLCGYWMRLESKLPSQVWSAKPETESL